jgi:putative transposase
MQEDNVISMNAPEASRDALTELLRNGARHLIEQAVEAELAELLKEYAERRDKTGRVGVVRNGYQPEREILTGIGAVKVKIPKVRSRLEEPVIFRSSIVPPYIRKSQTLESALPWLYLKGISSGQMQSALEVLVGPQAKGLSAGVISRLKRQWQEEYHQWSQQRWDRDQWVYLWVDGIYSGLRADQQRLCLLVIVGVNERGEKRFLAIEDGVRESTQSWREVLLNLKHRGLKPPKLAVGDGALGFWAAVEEIYPQTRQQRCWMHKTGNILNYLPKAVQPKAKTALQQIWMADTKVHAEKALKQFIDTYEAKYPKATNCLSKDRDVLLTFYDFPALHWQHLRTTNPIESAFATIRHRTDQSKGCLSRDTMLTMVFKIGMCAEKNWYRIRGFDQLPKVITGIPFKDGVEQPIDSKEAA